MRVCVIQACNQFNGSEKTLPIYYVSRKKLFLSITYAGQAFRNATLLTRLTCLDIKYMFFRETRH